MINSTDFEKLEAVALASKALAQYNFPDEPEWIRFMRAMEDIYEAAEGLLETIRSVEDESDLAAIQVDIQHIFWHIHDSRFLREVIKPVMEAPAT